MINYFFLIRKHEGVRIRMLVFVVPVPGHLLMSAKIPVTETNERKYWSKAQSLVPQLNLIQIQLDSYYWFLKEGIKEVLKEISPVEDFTGKNWTLELGSFYFGKPKYTAEQARDKGVTHDASLKIEAILTNKQTGQRRK